MIHWVENPLNLTSNQEEDQIDYKIRNMTTTAITIKKFDFKNKLQLGLQLIQPDWRVLFDAFLNLEVSKEFLKEEERSLNLKSIMKKLPISREPLKKYNFIYEKPPMNHYYFFIRGLYFEYGITLTRPDPIKALEQYLLGFEENQDPLCAFKLAHFYSLKRNRLGIKVKQFQELGTESKEMIDTNEINLEIQMIIFTFSKYFYNNSFIFYQKQDLEKAIFYLVMSSMLVDIKYAGNSFNIKIQMEKIINQFQQGAGISDILIQKYGGTYFSSEWKQIYQLLFDAQFCPQSQTQDKYEQLLNQLETLIIRQSDHFAFLLLFEIFTCNTINVADKYIKSIINIGLKTSKQCYQSALALIQQQIISLQQSNKDHIIFSNIRSVFYEISYILLFFFKLNYNNTNSSNMTTTHNYNNSINTNTNNSHINNNININNNSSIIEIYPMLFNVNETLYNKKTVLMRSSLHLSMTLRMKSDMLRKGLGVNKDTLKALEITLEELYIPKENENLYAYPNYAAAKLMRKLPQFSEQQIADLLIKSHNQFVNRLGSNNGGYSQVSDIVYLYYLGRISKVLKSDIIDSNNKYNQALQLYLIEKSKFKNTKTLQYEIICIKTENKTKSLGKASLLFSNQQNQLVQFDPIQKTQFVTQYQNQNASSYHQQSSTQFGQQSTLHYQPQMMQQQHVQSQSHQKLQNQNTSSQFGTQQSGSGFPNQLNNSRISQEQGRNSKSSYHLKTIENFNSNFINSNNDNNNNGNFPENNANLSQIKSQYSNERQSSAPNVGIANQNLNNSFQAQIQTQSDMQRGSILKSTTNNNKKPIFSTSARSNGEGQKSTTSPLKNQSLEQNNEQSNISPAFFQDQSALQIPQISSLGRSQQISSQAFQLKSSNQQLSEILPHDSHRSSQSEIAQNLIGLNQSNQQDKSLGIGNLGQSNMIVNGLSNGNENQGSGKKQLGLLIGQNNNLSVLGNSFNVSNNNNNNSQLLNQSNLSIQSGSRLLQQNNSNQNRGHFTIDAKMHKKLNDFKKFKVFVDPNTIVVLDLLKRGNNFTTSEAVILPSNNQIQQKISNDNLQKLRSFKKYMNSQCEDLLILSGEAVIVKQYNIFDIAQLDKILDQIVLQEMKLEGILTQYIKVQQQQQQQLQYLEQCKYIVPISSYSYQCASNESIYLYLIYPAQIYNLSSIKIRNLKLKNKLQISYQLLEIFIYLHSNNISNLNIIPNNILFDKQLIPYFTGWEQLQQLSDESSKEQSLSQENIIEFDSFDDTVSYTLGYSSPETINNNNNNKNIKNNTSNFNSQLAIKQQQQSFNSSSDVWSIGMILQLLFFDIDSSENNYLQSKGLYDSYDLVISEYQVGTNYYLDKAKQVIESMVKYDPKKRLNLTQAKDILQKLYFEFEKQEKAYQLQGSQINSPNNQFSSNIIPLNNFSSSNQHYQQMNETQQRQNYQISNSASPNNSNNRNMSLNNLSTSNFNFNNNYQSNNTSIRAQMQQQQPPQSQNLFHNSQYNSFNDPLINNSKFLNSRNPPLYQSNIHSSSDASLPTNKYNQNANNINNIHYRNQSNTMASQYNSSNYMNRGVPSYQN